MLSQAPEHTNILEYKVRLTEEKYKSETGWKKTGAIKLGSMICLACDIVVSGDGSSVECA